MSLAPLTTFSPLRIRSAETPPKPERMLTPGREMTREERKMARRRDGGGLETFTAYTAKRMTFTLPSVHLHDKQPTTGRRPSGNCIPAPLITQPTIVSLASETDALVDKNLTRSLQSEASKTQSSVSLNVERQKGPAAGPSASVAPKTQPNTSSRSKGRLSSEALAKGWGIQEPHLPSNIRGTRQNARSTSKADSSNSWQKGGKQQRTSGSKILADGVSRLGPDAKTKSSRKRLGQTDVERLGGLPAPPSPLPDRTQSSHSAGTTALSPPGELVGTRNSQLDSFTISQTTSQSAPQSPAGLETSHSTSSHTSNKRAGATVHAAADTGRKKPRVNPPTESKVVHPDAILGSILPSGDTLSAQEVEDEPRTNPLGLELQPVQPSGSHQRKVPTVESKVATVRTQKVSNRFERSMQASENSNPVNHPNSSNHATPDVSRSIITPVSYAKALKRGLSHPVGQFTSPPADAIVNKPAPTHLADITNTPHSVQRSGSLLMARPRKVAKDYTAAADPPSKKNVGTQLESGKPLSTTATAAVTKDKKQSADDQSRMAPQSSSRSQGNMINNSRRPGSPLAIHSPGSSQLARAPLPRGPDNQSQSAESPSDGLSAGASTSRDKRPIDTTRPWSPLNTEVTQPKKLKKLAHKIFTPGKPSGSSGLATGSVSAMLPPQAGPSLGRPIGGQNGVDMTKGVSNKDELYVVADRFVSHSDEFEEWETELSVGHTGLLTKIKNQLNPPDIISISIRKLLQDEIQSLEQEESESLTRKQEVEKQKARLQEVHNRFKLEMMEYSRQLVRHGLLKLKLQRLVEEEREVARKQAENKYFAPEPQGRKKDLASSASTRDLSQLGGGKREPANKQSKTSKPPNKDHAHLHAEKSIAATKDSQPNKEQTAKQTKAKKPAKKSGRSSRKAKR